MNIGYMIELLNFIILSIFGIYDIYCNYGK